MIFLLFASLLMAGSGSLAPDDADAADAYYTVNVDARREHIKSRYEEINSNIGRYKKIKGYPSYIEQNGGLSSDYDRDNVTSWVDNNGVLVKSIVKVPGRDLTVEVYHERLCKTGLTKNSAYLEDTVIYVFAYDNNGNEHRIYFDNGSYRIIRYIDNYKNKHDGDYRDNLFHNFFLAESLLRSYHFGACFHYSTSKAIISIPFVFLLR